LDLSAVSDLTALVMVANIEGTWHVEPVFWLPKSGLVEKSKADKVPYDRWVDAGLIEACPGKSISYDFVAHRIAEIWREYDVQAAAFDRWRMGDLKPRLIAAGLTDDDMELWQDFGQGYKTMGPAMNVLEADLLEGRLAHGNHPVLTMCAVNATVEQDAAGNRKLVKSARHRRIDGMVALVMARSVAGSAVSASNTEMDLVWL
jgi:phage terminase large subunit-like protein